MASARPGPIDFHTHLFSWAYFEALGKASPLPGEPAEKVERALRAAGIEPPSRDLATHVARFLGEMDRHGVRHAVAFASAPEEIPAVAQAAAMAKGRLTPFALVNPMAEGAAIRVRDLLARETSPALGGYRGVLLFPAMHLYSVREPAVSSLVGSVVERQGIVVVQCGMLGVHVRDVMGLPRKFDLAFANPLDLLPLANAFPSTPFVVPHFGAGFLRETLMLGAQCANVHVDTSSSNSWMRTSATPTTLREVFARALDVYGPRRILYGTDTSTLPRGYRDDLLAAQREALASLGAPAADQDLIFSGNAVRLLDL
jgi:predicted TIM-barrel fold metal-dependent hydrolase